MRRGAGAPAEVVSMDSVPSHISIGPFQSCNNTKDNTPGGAADIEGCQLSFSHAEEVADTHDVNEVVGSSSHYQGEATVLIHSYYQSLQHSIAQEGFANAWIAHLALSTGVGCAIPERAIENLQADADALCDFCDSSCQAGADTESSESSGELPLEEGSETESSGSSGEPRDVLGELGGTRGNRSNILDIIHDLVLEYAQTTSEAMGWIRVENVIGGARSMGIPSHESMDAMQTWCALNVMCISPEYDQIRFLVAPM